MHPPKQDVEHRIENLESQLKDALAQIEALKSSQSEAQDVPFGEIACRGLTVVDDEGNVMVKLTTDEHGGVVAAYGKEDDSTAQLSTNEYGGVMSMYDKDGQNMLEGGVGEHGGKVSAKGKDSGFVHMANNEHGGAVVAHGKDGGQASLLNNGDGGVVRADSSKDGGKAVLSNSRPHGASFNIYGGPNGAHVFRASVADDGGGIVETLDKNGYLTGNLP